MVNLTFAGAVWSREENRWVNRELVYKAWREWCEEQLEEVHARLLVVRPDIFGQLHNYRVV